MNLTDAEALVLKDFLEQDTPLRAVITKFANQRGDYMRRESTDAMKTVPRQFEKAADYAAKADVYETFLSDLQSFARQG